MARGRGEGSLGATSNLQCIHTIVMKVEKFLFFAFGLYKVNASIQPDTLAKSDIDFPTIVRKIRNSDTRIEGIEALSSLLPGIGPERIGVGETTCINQIFTLFVRGGMGVDEQKGLLSIIDRFLEIAPEFSVPLAFSTGLVPQLVSLVGGFQFDKPALISLARIVSYSNFEYLGKVLEQGLINKVSSLLRKAKNILVMPDPDMKGVHINLIEIALQIIKGCLNNPRVTAPLISPILNSLNGIDDDNFVHSSIHSIFLLMTHFPTNNDELTNLLLNEKAIEILVKLPFLDRLDYDRLFALEDDETAVSSSEVKGTAEMIIVILGKLLSQGRVDLLNGNKVFRIAIDFFKLGRFPSFKKPAIDCLASLVLVDVGFAVKFLEDEQCVVALNRDLERPIGVLQSSLVTFITNMFNDFQNLSSKLLLIKAIPFLNDYLENGDDVNSLSKCVTLVEFLWANVDDNDKFIEELGRINMDGVHRAQELINNNPIAPKKEDGDPKPLLVPDDDDDTMKKTQEKILKHFWDKYNNTLQ